MTITQEDLSYVKRLTIDERWRVFDRIEAEMSKTEPDREDILTRLKKELDIA